MKKLELKCNCCGHMEEFDSRDTAWKDGWDMGTFNACGLCPYVFASDMVPKSHPDYQNHMKAHERWKEEGRPT